MTATRPRQLHLNINALHSGFVPSAWRLPESEPDAFIDVHHYVRLARIAEVGKRIGKIAGDLPKDHLICMNMCGRGDKDIFTVAEMLGVDL